MRTRLVAVAFVLILESSALAVDSKKLGVEMHEQERPRPRQRQQLAKENRNAKSGYQQLMDYRDYPPFRHRPCFPRPPRDTKDPIHNEQQRQQLAKEDGNAKSGSQQLTDYDLPPRRRRCYPRRPPSPRVPQFPRPPISPSIPPPYPPPACPCPCPHNLPPREC